MQFNLYTILLFLSAAVSGCLGIYAWKRRSLPAGTEMALLLFAIALWALFQGLEGFVTIRFWKMFFSAASYVGSQSTSVLFFIFALRYTAKDRWLTARNVVLLWILPAVSVVMACTSGFQHLLWTRVTLTHTVAGVTAIYSHGPWYWLELVYGYALILGGMAALLYAVIRLPHIYSWQARLMLAAAVLPLIGHVIYSFSPSSVDGLDITPITFTITGVLIAAAVFRYRLLDLRPIAGNVLYEGIGDAMIALDSSNRVVDINPAAQALLGLSEDSAVGADASLVFARTPGVAERLADGEDTEQGDIVIESVGSRSYFDLTVWPLQSRTDRLLGRLVTLHDVTENRLAQEELKRKNAELEGFAHTVSHDLKAPLTTIGLANEAVERYLSQPESRERDDAIRQMLTVAHGNTRKAAKLINGLLALAKAGQKPVRVQQVPVAHEVERILEERADEISRRGVHVNVGELGSVRADPTHVYLLFSNLIGNSIQHNNAASPEIDIQLLDRENGSHTYLVRDNGETMGECEMEKLFEPFYSCGETATTGIGLSTVQRIVSVYGGSIRAYQDRGACFEFTLHDYPSLPQ